MISPARPEHLEWLTELAVSSADCSLTSGQLTSYLEKNQLLIVQSDNEQPVGLIAYRKILEEAELDQILIAPDFRNQGLARSALIQWHEHLRNSNVKSVFLEVRDGNVPALRLYQHLDYQVTGRRKNYYQFADDKHDALLMTKVLDPSE